MELLEKATRKPGHPANQNKLGGEKP